MQYWIIMIQNYLMHCFDRLHCIKVKADLNNKIKTEIETEQSNKEHNGRYLTVF